MSSELISHSPDLKRLRDEGYEVALSAGYVVVTGLPYVTASRTIMTGILMKAYTVAGDRVAISGDHTVHFAGEFPCHRDGTAIEALRHQSARVQLTPDLTGDHSFSNKPPQGYADFYELITTYAAILAGPAQSLDPSATPRTFNVVEAREEESVFRYVDTASSRADIVMAARKLEHENVAIVGLGGTGAYVFDLVAKTLAKNIHLFDGDRFLSHNAFRAPGAPSIGTLREVPNKAQYYLKLYEPMRRGLVAHPFHIDSSNAHLLSGMNFVFVCVDNGTARRQIVEALVSAGVPFVDTGMGVQQVNDQLFGTLRVTTDSTLRPKNLDLAKVLPLADMTEDDVYDKNIQIADLNALCATLAVIRWKKLAGFYVDNEREHHTTYSINMNLLTSDGCA